MRRRNKTTGWGISSGSHWLRRSFFLTYNRSGMVGPALWPSRSLARKHLPEAQRSFPKATVRRVVLTVRAA